MTLSKIYAQKRERCSHELYIEHFNELHQELPLWACVDLMTIANISFLYSISEPQIKTAVAMEMGFNVGKCNVLGDFLHNVKFLRNLCAHGSRLFNRFFEQMPRLSSKEKKLLIKKKDGFPDNSHLYSYVLVMRRLLSPKDFQGMKTKIIALTEKYPFVRMDYYGFRDDWKSTL